MKKKNTISVNCLAIAAVCLLPLPLLSHAHSWMAPQQYAKQQNPQAADEESVHFGKALFTEHCAFCHGKEAEGLDHQSTGLQKDTPNLPKRLATHSDGDFHWKIKNGKGNMSSFVERLGDDDIWNIINYIKTLP